MKYAIEKKSIVWQNMNIYTTSKLFPGMVIKPIMISVDRLSYLDIMFWLVDLKVKYVSDTMSSFTALAIRPCQLKILRY